MNKEEFIKEAEKLNIQITEDMMNKLNEYYLLLVENNKKMNLTAITEEKEVYLKHFYDSLTLTKVIDLNNELKLCDIGTGAGFPGLVLKIIYPTLDITLVDALDKRIKFLNEVIEKLELSKIKTVHSRIEDLKDNEEFDVVVSRAVAYTPTLLELGSQLPKVNGYFILMKGNIKEELKDSKNALNTLHYEIEKIESFVLPIENSERNIIKLKKYAKTPIKYPRLFAQIKKKPL